MTPDPKSPIFIRHDLPENASKTAHILFEAYKEITNLASSEEWVGVTPQNFTFEYSTYYGHAEILFNFIDKNDHCHKITVGYYGDDVSTSCWFTYLFKAENFDENACFVQSFAECLMVQLWEFGIDADLCECDWGLEFMSSTDSVVHNMGILINTITSSIKPMEWFYSDEPIWKFDKIHSHLKQLLPQLKHEAETGRWRGVKPENFTIQRDKTQAFIVLTYQDEGLYEMTFKVGFGKNGFDPDASGKWFTCEYRFNNTSSNSEIRKYYLKEQQDFCKLASTILDWTAYRYLFAYDSDDTALTLLVERKWAFLKYCYMLDVMLPLLFNHKASKPLVTKNILDQKTILETQLNTTMEIAEEAEPAPIFNNGHFLSLPEANNTNYNEDNSF